jgi:hypothetical protein
MGLVKSRRGLKRARIQLERLSRLYSPFHAIIFRLCCRRFVEERLFGDIENPFEAIR